ncbi:putative serine/threonine-protein kinase-like protein CCR3 [Camellia lanceoleosa]|uniref:Serine/threonine-protein kinase-like protein CCR3 n=1 Tax=Camellia lanceoleosa TaxID=1840588 RepID=A0ACC0IYP3_9ERIC|nr:putative serine/threonine-protein kinase-like protein CCR3 [Camellia lanceoleosa]
MRRQRSGTSSKHADKAEELSFSDLVAATNNFSLENKIGAGSFGVVYRGKLWDGRDVAIKRGETGLKMKKFQEKESAFESELAFLSRLHHKHLVKLVGYCEEGDERLLVYEYMKNGALYDHLHDKNNSDGSENGGAPTSVVDFAVPAIMAGEMGKILDKRVGPLEVHEAEAVELVGYIAMHCVNLEGKDRPNMADIVANLERALDLCDDSHGSISSGQISIASE